MPFYNSTLIGLGYVKTVTVYDVFHTFPVAAGIGHYNVSYINSYPPSQVSVYVAILFSTLFADTTNTLPVIPVSCKSDDCSSYLFPGSFLTFTPWPWRVPGFSDADVLIVHGVEGIQIDYGNIDPADHLGSGDCKIYGAENAAIMLCIASSTVNPSELIAGLGPFRIK